MPMPGPMPMPTALGGMPPALGGVPPTLAGARPPGAPAPGGAPGGAAGLPPEIMKMLMLFFAGAGFRDVVANIKKLQSKPAEGAGRQHVGGVRAEAAKNPGMTVAPQLAQQMAAGGGGAAPAGVPPQLGQMIQQILQRRQGMA